MAGEYVRSESRCGLATLAHAPLTRVKLNWPRSCPATSRAQNGRAGRRGATSRSRTRSLRSRSFSGPRPRTSGTARRKSANQPIYRAPTRLTRPSAARMEPHHRTLPCLSGSWIYSLTSLRQWPQTCSRWAQRFKRFSDGFKSHPTRGAQARAVSRGTTQPNDEVDQLAVPLFFGASPLHRPLLIGNRHDRRCYPLTGTRNVGHSSCLPTAHRPRPNPTRLRRGEATEDVGG